MDKGTILDARGNPVQVKQLQRELAGSTASVRGTEFDSMANKLTPAKLAGILNEIQDDPANFLTLAMEMEEREPHYASVLSTRKLAISGIVPVVEAASEEEADQELAEEVQQLINRPNFTDLCEDLLDALGKGFSVAEIMWAATESRWTPAEYRWRDPRWFIFNYDQGEQLRLRDEEISEGIALPPYKFVVHYPRLRSGLTIRSGLARLACVSYMCKNYDLKDWMRFIELFGQPLRTGRYDSTASETDRNILKRAVTMLGVDAAAILPKGMEIEFNEIGNVSAGATVYEKLANWLDKQVSKAVLGQTMTADDGSSQSQATVHDEVRRDILKADARRLSATLNEQLVKPFIDLNFGTQEAYPRIIIPVEDPEDLTAWTTNVAAMVDKGLKVSQKHVRDKLNLPDPEGDEELLMPPAATTPDPAGALNATDKYKGLDGWVIETQHGYYPSGTWGMATTRPTRAEALNALRTPLHRLNRALNPSTGEIIYASAINTAEQDDLEEILAAALEGWQAIKDESFTPLKDRLAACSSYDELKAVLDDPGMEAGELTHALALAMFKARGSADHD